MARDLDREHRRALARDARALGGLGAVEVGSGPGAAGVELLQARELGLGELGFARGDLDLLLAGLELGLTHLHPGLGLGAGPRVEERGAQRLDRHDRLALAHGVADLEGHPLAVARHRRRDHVAVLDPGLALLAHGDLQRAAGDLAQGDLGRARHEAVDDRGHEAEGEGEEQEASEPAHGHSRVLSTATRSSRSRRRRTIKADTLAEIRTTSAAKV
ncbi:MAG: hypothetical protein R3F62_30765 [Planctomycetota bacterium]